MRSEAPSQHFHRPKMVHVITKWNLTRVRSSFILLSLPSLSPSQPTKSRPKTIKKICRLWDVRFPFHCKNLQTHQNPFHFPWIPPKITSQNASTPWFQMQAHNLNSFTQTHPLSQWSTGFQSLTQMKLTTLQAKLFADTLSPLPQMWGGLVMELALFGLEMT